MAGGKPSWYTDAMPFRQAGSLRFFEFESLSHPDLVQGIFTRRGGVSPEPWRSLNVGGTVGDERTRVLENRRRSFGAVGRGMDSIYDVWQVHSAEVVVAHAPRREGRLVQADALATDSPDVTLFMRFADCLPVFLFDPTRLAVGVVHAGWLGTVRRAASAAVQTMVRAFGCRPSDLRAGLGPSIGPDHYPIGDEVVREVRHAFGKQADAHLSVHDGAVHFDLWSANRQSLEEQGVASIEIAGICTACHLEDWFSHRGERGRTGRFGGLLAIKSG